MQAPLLCDFISVFLHRKNIVSKLKRILQIKRKSDLLLNFHADTQKSSKY